MAEHRKKIYYLTPVLLAVLIFASNFLSTELFRFGELKFAVWFVLSLFCFACGWLINKTLGWKFGGRIVFSVVIATTVISVALISFLREYFGASDLLAENLILYSLRNVTLGCMGLFGMSVDEVMTLQKEKILLNTKIDNLEQSKDSYHKEAELELREAKLKADKIVRDAELQAKALNEKKERLEGQLREFIQVERELIKKYEGI